MRTIVAGSRGITDISVVREAVDASGFRVTEVVSGGARGVDRLGERLAGEMGVPCRVFPADWETHGRSAGVIRNRLMAGYADALVAVWDGSSRGTANMISQARRHGLEVYVHRC
jgi:predicted Rossmann fold nucleotide-binding protein DprA/Smf involved in DNA uptake